MLNMDFAQRVVIDTRQQTRQASPKAGVWRKPLAREEAERGHATSVVKYDPGSSFPEHDHPLGEEILVLSGTFSDHTGDYRAGTYFRNPQGFRHAPYSEEGCVILVKLHQFQPDDTAHVVIDTTSADWQAGNGNLEVLPLHDFGSEQVALVRWPENSSFPFHCHPDGEEIFVLSGELIDEHGRYPTGTWLRSPHMSKHRARVEVETVLWVKTGHLPASIKGEPS